MQLKHLFLILLCFYSVRYFAQSTASQQVETFTIEAPQLQAHKKIWVYFPKNYKNSENAYPVIYMHDAQNLFDAETSYVGEWKIDEFLDTTSYSESIIIGIEHGNEKRTEELTPYPNETYGGGNGNLYLDFIKNTLKPHVDLTYRTITDSDHTTIIGSSLGGLISFYAAVKYPETFGNAGVFSPSFWFSDDIYELVKASKIHINSRFYFLAGTDEDDIMVADLNKMVQLLLYKGVNPLHIQTKIIEGGTHNEAMWSAEFPEAYQWLTKNY